ncbi:hypothetical protein YN1_0370 [Nanoarchaeota archaeon]
MYYLLPLLIVDGIILGISSYQDIKQKSVDDIIIYILFIFNISYFLFMIFSGYYPNNILFSYIIFLFFVILYSLRLLAIGDLYIFFSIILLLSFLSIKILLSFIIYLFLFGFIFHNIEGVKVFYKKNKKCFYLSIINIILVLFSISFIYYFLISFVLYYLLISLALIYISYFIFKIFEKNIREELTFKRKVNELVEGDWIEDMIEINNIKEEDLEKVKKYFDIEKKDKYIIKFKKGSIVNQIILIIFSLIPIIFYFINIFYFYISLIAILIIFHLFQNKIFKGRTGLSKEEIEILKKLSEYNDITVEVSEGAPFVPPIFFALILSII